MMSFLTLFFELLLIKRKSCRSSIPITEVTKKRPIEFPHLNSDAHYGFVNSLNNKNGLQALFFIDDSKSVSCAWSNTASHFQGFSGIIHGGVLVALADELMANCVVGLKQKFGVTLSSRIQWKAPVRVGETVSGRASIVASYKHFLLIEFVLINSEGKEVLTGSGIFYLPTIKQFKKMTGMNLPDALHSYLRN
jgi:acyl-coenzyme A thioesterase PaaI-like protein